MIRAILLLAAFLVIAVVPTEASIAFNPFLTCQKQNIRGRVQRVCATYYAYGPSPAAFPNGTVVYLGPTGYDYTYWKGLRNKTDTSLITNTDKHLLEPTVSVSWENGACQVKIGDTQCSACSLCQEAEFSAADTTLSADCTNIPGGRQVTCEKAFIYFPLKKNRRHRKNKKASSKSGMMGGMMRQ